MAIIGENELKAQIKNNDLSGVYFIYGEESYLKEFYVNKIKKKVVDPAFADFTFHQYEGKKSSMDDILMDAQMVPMMSEYVLVLVNDYPLDGNKSDMEKLKTFFKEIPDTCVLIFRYDAIEVDPKRNAKWNTVINHFSKAGSVVQLEKRSEADLVRLIVSSAKKRNCTIEPQRAKYLISIVGSDIQTIFNELEKICSYVQSGEITREHIDELAVKSLQARVYDLSKFILRGDSDGAYGVLNTLFAQKEEPIMILSVISSCYVDMYRVKCAKAANFPESDIANYFSYKGRDFLIRNAARDASQISRTSLRNALDILAKTDEMMKSSAVNKNLLLEETVAKLLMIRGK